jgi:hypothetical protein
MLREIGQSLRLMALMGGVLASYVALALWVVRVLG